MSLLHFFRVVDKEVVKNSPFVDVRIFGPLFSVDKKYLSELTKP